jgi:outer membrane protein assembly factor BamB
LAAAACAVSAQQVADGAPTVKTIGLSRADVSRTGFMPIDLKLPLSVAWQNTTDEVSGNTSSPVAADGLIFFGAANTVYAVNADDGSIKWQYPTSGATNRWTAPKPFYGTPTVADGKVYIGNDDKSLYVLDEMTGDKVGAVETHGAVRSAPVVNNGVVFFGSDDDYLYAVREDNLQTVWSKQTSGPIDAAVVINGDNVLFADGNDTLYNAAQSNGRLLWQVQFDNSLNDSVPAVAAFGTIYVAIGADLYGLVPSNGAIKWKTTLPSDVSATLTLSANNNTLYAPTIDGRLIALSPRGQVVWTTKLDGTVNAAPAATNNAVIVATSNGVVEAVSTDPDANGAIIWCYSFRAIKSPVSMKYGDCGYVTATPLVLKGAVYTLGNEGTLTAFSSSAVDQIPPDATLNAPATDKKVAGSQIPYSIKVTDTGSGVDPNSVVLTVDGAKLPVVYSPKTDLITVKLTEVIVDGVSAGTKPQHLDTLADGDHTLVLKVADWRGNTLTKTWQFSVDSTLDPADATPPIAAPIQSSSDSAPADSESSSPSTNATGLTGAPAPTLGTGAALGSSSDSHTDSSTAAKSASPVIRSGTPSGSGSSTTPAPTHSVPIAPPGQNNFPPPPPI